MGRPVWRTGPRYNASQYDAQPCPLAVALRCRPVPSVPSRSPFKILKGQTVRRHPNPMPYYWPRHFKAAPETAPETRERHPKHTRIKCHTIGQGTSKRTRNTPESNAILLAKAPQSGTGHRTRKPCAAPERYPNQVPYYWPRNVPAHLKHTHIQCHTIGQGTSKRHPQPHPKVVRGTRRTPEWVVQDSFSQSSWGILSVASFWKKL